MKFTILAAAIASASAVNGHAMVREVFVNGVNQGLGLGSYIRNVPNNSPVKDLASKNMICNVGNTAAPKTLEVKAGDQITFEWSHDSPRDDIIDPTHKGPVQVYIAPTSSNGNGAVWNKIFSQGFTDDWATNKLIAAKGAVTVTVPSIEAGEYLFRPEIIALHEGDIAFNTNSARGAQFYMECVQIKVTSSGSKLPAGVDFLKDYTYADKGIVFSLYDGTAASSYVAPGGPLSSVAVVGQLGIGPVPAAGSILTSAAVPTSASAATSAITSASAAAPITTAVVPTTRVVSTKAVVPTSAAVSASAEEPVTSVVVSTSRAPLPTTKMATVTVKAPTASACPSADNVSNAAVPMYYQCGGINYRGSTTCAAGSTCKVQNPYYSQCL